MSLELGCIPYGTCWDTVIGNEVATSRYQGVPRRSMADAIAIPWPVAYHIGHTVARVDGAAHDEVERAFGGCLCIWWLPGGSPVVAMITIRWWQASEDPSMYLSSLGIIEVPYHGHSLPYLHRCSLPYSKSSLAQGLIP